MRNYIAYIIGGTKAYPVTQMRREGVETFIVFNSSWHNSKDCILCIGSDVNDCAGNEIFEGDIIQLTSGDQSCPYKNKIGVATYRNGRFSWSVEGSYYPGYDLAGKSWRKLGNVACDMDKYFLDKQIVSSNYLTGVREKIKGNYNGVLIEKYSAKAYIVQKYHQRLSNEPSPININKYEKKLLHQYKNYLKIKSLIDDGTLDTEILDENYRKLRIQEYA